MEKELKKLAVGFAEETYLKDITVNRHRALQLRTTF